ncbi:MAG: bifunctional alpha,alpha-trehalose-phosphate synthase (UDP-forming)/trehalose-phosphatase [Bacteroidales bacterium]
MITQFNYTFKRIILVAYRLPFSIHKNGGEKKLVQNSGGLVSAVLSLSEKMNAEKKRKISNKIVWIGYSEHTKKEFEELETNESPFDINPVKIDHEINSKYYNGFCNDFIWPLFHYFPSLAIFNESYFESYIKANELFFDELEKIIQPDDMIWVHDYQLFWLPKLIRNKYPKACVGFFLHIPFPSFEIFRMMHRNWRETILKGMLGADLIGFHTNDYTQNFLTTVKRLLGNEILVRKIKIDDRIVKADAFPIGIDYEKFLKTSKSPEVSAEIKKLKLQLGNYKFIFSVDRLDYTKGIRHRLFGLEYFLEKYPEWIGKVIFNLVVVPSRDKITRYKELKKEIDAIVGRINGKYSTLDWRPIIYQYKSLDFHQMIALYSFSHVGLITPLRDGMNLVAKEYVVCQEYNTGVLILSELAGAVAELGESIIINPLDKVEVADAIHMALEMSMDEKTTRNLHMKGRLKNYDVFSWANDFLNQLQSVKNEQKTMEIRYINNKVENEIIKNYQQSHNRIIFLDYDGTLVPFKSEPLEATPDINIINLIEKLAHDKKNTIILLSGRDSNFLERWFGNLNIILASEHGAFQKNYNENWTFNTEANVEWKEFILSVLQKYTDRCFGSQIEEKETSVAWHYRNADSEFAFVRSQELISELNELILLDKSLQVLEGNKVIEIKNAGITKGTFAKKYLSVNEYQFILAIGDDRTDEDLFKEIPPWGYSIKVGTDQSLAKFNLKHPADVLELLEKLCKCS